MTFANPAALWLLLAVPPLAALYFLKVRRRRVRVATTLLWETVLRNRRTARPWDRFRNHLLFWLQLLLLLMLVFALSGPSVPGEGRFGRSTVWVIDASASMAAVAPGPSRFARARDLVKDGIRQMEATDEAMLLLAGAEPRVVLSFTRDQARLAAAIDDMKPTGAAGSLGTAVDLAVALTRSRPDRAVVVVTDGSDRSLDLALGRHPDVVVRRVGRSAGNVAITAIDLRRSPTQDLESELFVTLRRFSGEGGPVDIEVSLDDAPIAKETVDVPADRPIARVFRDLGDSGGLVRVHLETGDALRLDDDAVAWLSPPRRRSILCVSCNALTMRAILVDDRFRLESAATDLEASRFDAVIYEGGEVPAQPAAPFLALGPSRVGETAFTEQVEWPRVTSWKRAHPALRFVEPAGLHVSKALTAGLPGWAPLLESDAGPLLTTGLLGGKRGLLLHFEPLASDLPLRVAYPLFLLNSISWLTGEEAPGRSRTLPAGRPLLREGWGDDGEEVSLSRPDGSTLTVPIRDGTARFGALEQTGVHVLEGPGGRRERVAVNLVSERESDLAVAAHEPVTTDGVAQASVAALGRRSLVRPTLALFALLLCFEWWAWQRRYRDD